MKPKPEVIHRERIQPRDVNDVPGKGKYAHITYCKVRLSSIEQAEPHAQAKEAVSLLSDLIQCVRQYDKSAALLQFRGGANTAKKTLRPEMLFPTTKTGWLPYLDRLWLQQGKYPYCRLKLLHNEPFDTIETDDFTNWLKDRDMLFHREKIQSHEVKKVGFLVGVHSKAINVNHLKDALKTYESLKNIDIEVRVNFAIFTSGKGGKKSDKKVPHVYTGAENTERVRLALRKIYSFTGEHFPLFIVARFIPDVTDDKHIIPAGAPQLALRASTEHDAFMLNTRTVSAWHIIGLDSLIDDGTTCREAIMKIRSNKTGDRSLFVAAAEM